MGKATYPAKIYFKCSLVSSFSHLGRGPASPEKVSRGYIHEGNQ
jgi:hypothetical protein